MGVQAAPTPPYTPLLLDFFSVPSSNRSGFLTAVDAFLVEISNELTGFLIDCGVSVAYPRPHELSQKPKLHVLSCPVNPDPE
jgi:hypothetical protein